ncbi:hypothetical protein [Burkholderia sp. Tr-20390]|uniref:hypothetical protein n=1 Tax=Burkholderia sp. Tr-20390 TaxID=2703904 RepID=UPI0019807968|nr:hypothetical protein [Burkholderia sp. Tr-20390]MBN3729366.1 hypothetical protein [Burkholderia sp. Tr-20390]
MLTNDDEYAGDPNAPTENQMRLKRVETAIRRRGSCHLLMQLDGITFIADRAQQMLALKNLKSELES